MLRVTELCRYSKDNISAILAELRGFEKDYIARANLGTFWHSWVLRNERESAPANIEIIKAQDYRTKEARELRDSALKAGKTPLLEKEFADFNQGFEFLKTALYQIFDSSFKFEVEIKGNLQGLDLMGHIDCLSDEKIIDLKISEVAFDLNKHIFDMRYNLQMYLYMLLTNRICAELVFVNPKALTIQIKSMLKAEIEAECEVLINRAIDNMSIINSALDEPYIERTEYSTPQWALANLTKGA